MERRILPTGLVEVTYDSFSSDALREDFNTGWRHERLYGFQLPRVSPILDVTLNGFVSTYPNDGSQTYADPWFSNVPGHRTGGVVNTTYIDNLPDFHFHFSKPAARVGFWLGGGSAGHPFGPVRYDVSFYGNSGLLGTLQRSSNGIGDAKFVGVESEIGITNIVVTNLTTFWAAFLDDFVVELANSVDLTADSFARNSTDAGYNFKYSVTGNLTEASTAKVFWASGPTASDRIPNTAPVFTQNITAGDRSQATQYSATIPASSLVNPPTGAKYLVMVLDDKNSVDESNESNNTAGVRIPNVFANAIRWSNSDGGVDIDVSVGIGTLDEDTPFSLYWSADSTFSARIGAPFYEGTVKGGTSGSKTFHVSPNEFRSNIPFSIDSFSPKLLASYMIVKIDPAILDSNTKALALKTVRLGEDFTMAMDGVTLDLPLIYQVMALSSHLIAHNLVNGDIVLNEAVRSPRLAHLWSTAYYFLSTPKTSKLVPSILKNLQSLPGGRDLDGNRWYDNSWEDGLKVNGLFSKFALSKLWERVQANALALASLTRSDPRADAAEGYPEDDPQKRYFPNRPRKVSNHIAGNAIDVTIPWRSGAKLGTALIKDGGTSDLVANRIVDQFGLSRPVKKEKWHIQMK